MTRDRPGPDHDRLIVARLDCIAQRHARWGAATEDEMTAGAAELRELAGDRPDLLAEVAGIALGASEGKGPEYGARSQAVAGLCRLAGADEDAIPQLDQGGSQAGSQRRPAAVLGQAAPAPLTVDGHNVRNVRVQRGVVRVVGRNIRARTGGDGRRAHDAGLNPHDQHDNQERDQDEQGRQLSHGAPPSRCCHQPAATTGNCQSPRRHDSCHPADN